MNSKITHLEPKRRKSIFRGITGPSEIKKKKKMWLTWTVNEERLQSSILRSCLEYNGLSLRKTTVYVRPTWWELHLADHFSLMDVASVTMFWACFSNGMSIILPRKVKAPWKTENTNFLKECSEIIGFLSVHTCTTRTFQIPPELYWLSYPTFEKAKVNYRGQTSFLPPKEGEEKKKTLQCFNGEEKPSDTRYWKLFI